MLTVLVFFIKPWLEEINSFVVRRVFYFVELVFNFLRYPTLARHQCRNFLLETEVRSSENDHSLKIEETFAFSNEIAIAQDQIVSLIDFMPRRMNKKN